MPHGIFSGVLLGERIPQWPRRLSSILDINYIKQFFGRNAFPVFFSSPSPTRSPNFVFLGEYDLKHLGKGAVLNHASLLFSHSVERGRESSVEFHAHEVSLCWTLHQWNQLGCNFMRGTLIFRHTALEEASQLGVNCVAEAGALLMKGGTLLSGQATGNGSDRNGIRSVKIESDRRMPEARRQAESSRISFTGGPCRCGEGGKCRGNPAIPDIFIPFFHSFFSFNVFSRKLS